MFSCHYSNSCGQEGRSYQDETCGIYSCAVDPNMEVTAINAANAIRAPPPFECTPAKGFTGYWDTRTGAEITDAPYSNTLGRTDVQGEPLCELHSIHFYPTVLNTYLIFPTINDIVKRLLFLGEIWSQD